MTPNTRIRKSRLAEQPTEEVLSFELSQSEQVEVLTLTMKKLGIMDQIRFSQKPTESGTILN